MKKLREMFPDGMYTDNGKDVFERFKELLEDDKRDSDESNYDRSKYCGTYSLGGLPLSQFNYAETYGINAVYLTNEEFFKITLDDAPEHLKEVIKLKDTYIPKVGEECEVSLDDGLRWYKFVKTDKRNLILDEHWGEMLEGLHLKFRPLLTERELFIQQGIDDLTGLNPYNSLGEILGKLFDKGYTKGETK